MLCAAAAFLPAVASQSGEKRAGKHGGRRERSGRGQSGRRRGKGLGAQASSERQPNAGSLIASDSGARWRIKALASGRYLYKNDNAITGNNDFFSLFELRRTLDGAYLIKDHSGGWLCFQQDGSQGELPKLGMGKSMVAPPPPPPPPMTKRELLDAFQDAKANLAAVQAKAAEEAAEFAAVKAKAAIDEAQRFHLDEQPDGAYALRLAGPSASYVYENVHDPSFQFVSIGAGAWAAPGDGSVLSRWFGGGGQAGSSAGGGSARKPFNESALFELQRVVAPHKKALREDKKGAGRTDKSFMRRVLRSTVHVSGRDVVVATYHNIGMLDWATLFWGWLATSGIDRFMLLELDGVTCEAARNLNCTLQFECATAADMKLPQQFMLGSEAGALAEWGTSAESAYFKFLRWKLRLVELCLEKGVDVVMIDVDVLVLSPQFFTTLVNSPSDLVISSDAREGSFSDNRHCPCSHPQYQRYTTDWVCAGLFFMRATDASLWFMRETQQLMDEFTITDQDAIQALLTGHTQVAIPQTTTRPNETDTDTRRLGQRPSNQWLKPLWLEGLGPHEDLRNQGGMLPLNTPMKEAMRKKYRAKMAMHKFTFQILPLNTFGNGPMLVDKWDDVFSRPYRAGGVGGGGFAGKYLSIHANCWTKQWITDVERVAATTKSFLFDPRVKYAVPQPRSVGASGDDAEGQR